MKKIILGIMTATFLCIGYCNAKSFINSQTNAGMQMYKNRNYTECMQVMYKEVSKDPSNVLAYYYIAMSEARLGKVDKAKEAYQRVIDLNSSTQLTRYAKNGIECLDDATKCKTAFSLDPSKKAIDKVNSEMEASKIETIKSIKNSSQDVPPEYIRGLKDYSKPKNQIQNKSAAPTKEEIADALDVLKRAGYQNVMPQAPMTPEMAEINMINSMANNQNGYGYMNPMANFFPYVMNNNTQNGNQPDPQLMQTLMMNSMMNGL